MFTVSVAVLLSLGHVTVIVTGTVPGCVVVQRVWRSAGCAIVPEGAVQRYVTAHEIESVTVAVTVELWPTSIVQGSHAARTLRLCCGATGASGGGGGGGGGGGT